MKKIFLLFPHQLFRNTDALKKVDEVVLIEEFLFFNQYNFHKQKIAFHRASMQYYKDFLAEQQIEATYFDAQQQEGKIELIIPHLFLSNKQIEFHAYETDDNWLHKHITQAIHQVNASLVWHASKLFINTNEENEAYYNSKKKLFQTDYYIQQRKRLHILIDDNGKPVAGKWSFDEENRNKLPANHIVPTVEFPAENKYIKEAKQYVDLYYPSNLGVLSAHFNYPVTHIQAEHWLKQFLQQRLSHFGTYEDAISRNEHILYHSLLSPLINVGLLNVNEVLNEITSYANKQEQIGINNVEGLIRQIIGWREFIKAVYQLKGTTQRNSNFWQFENRPLPNSLYTATTGIMPIDETINKIIKTGYCHHIERLMILGNFMLLVELHPHQVYRWFMELFIDAYDWVMVPNVYGMSQFADAGMMSTKPYISGSNYIIKMSDYKKDGKWDVIWDALFWRFMHVHRQFFLSNPRLGMLVKTFDKMDTLKKEKHLDIANQFISNFYKQI